MTLYILNAIVVFIFSDLLAMTGPMLVIAVIGLIVNLIVAFTLSKHDHDDLNTRSAFLHVLGDA